MGSDNSKTYKGSSPKKMELSLPSIKSDPEKEFLDKCEVIRKEFPQYFENGPKECLFCLEKKIANEKKAQNNLFISSEKPNRLYFRGYEENLKAKSSNINKQAEEKKKDSEKLEKNTEKLLDLQNVEILANPLEDTVKVTNLLNKVPKYIDEDNYLPNSFGGISKITKFIKNGTDTDFRDFHSNLEVYLKSEDAPNEKLRAALKMLKDLIEKEIFANPNPKNLMDKCFNFIEIYFQHLHYDF